MKPGKLIALLIGVMMIAVSCVAVSAVLNTGLKLACELSGGIGCVDNIQKLLSLVFTKSSPTEACIQRDKAQRLPKERRIDEIAPLEVATGQSSPYAPVRLTELMTYGIMTNYGDPDRPGEMGLAGIQPGLEPYFKDVTVEDAPKLTVTAKVLAEAYEHLIVQTDAQAWNDSPATEAVKLIEIVYANHPGYWQRFGNTSDPKTKTDMTLSVYERALDLMKEQGWSLDFVNERPDVAPLSADPLGQRLFVGTSDVNVAKELATKDIGGLFIGSSSGGRVSDELKAALPELQSTAPSGLIIATDQEYTDSVNSMGLADGKKASDLASMSDADAQAAGAEMGKSLAALGVNMNFAPVVDLQIDGSGDNPIADNDRGISSDPAVVTAKAAAFILGQGSEKVLSVIKHFPGHGRTTGDSHTSLPTTPELAAMEGSDITVFRDLAIIAGTHVMMGHLNVPGLTNGQPASMSPEAYRYLRDNLKFEGLAITDELGGMAGAGEGSLTDKVANALNAGADMALFNVSSVQEFETVYNGLQGRLQFEEDSRIARTKQALGVLSIRGPPEGESPSGVANGGEVGNLDGAKVPEPMRSIIIRAVKSENLDPDGWGPAFIAAIYLTENNGFPWANDEIDGGEGEGAYRKLNTDSPEWKLAAYGEDGIWAPNSGPFQGPGQFGPPAWADYGRDGDGDGEKNRWSFADTMPAIAAYLKGLGATAGDFDSFVEAARQYNGQGDFYGGIVNPGGRFEKIQHLYAYQAGQLAKALTGGDTNGQTVVNDCIAEQTAELTLAAGVSTGGDDPRSKVIEAAKTQLGIRYSWGGGDLEGPTVGTTYACTSACYANNDPTTPGWDCSAFVRYAMYKGTGFELPRTSEAQYQATANYRKTAETAEPGDLVFWPGHVAMVIGNGQMIEAPQSGLSVRITEIRSNPRGFGDPFALAAG